MEASALQAPAGLARPRISLGASLLRLRTDEQLVSLFRAGSDEAFRVIHDRYRQRLFAYTRQMFPGSRQDAEDALQDIFVRAYSGLRANNRELALRAWLYRVAHNRCIDELRRPAPPLPEVMEFVRPPVQDPVAKAEQREELGRLIADVQRLPDQQRSALLMRELGGMTYVDLAGALGVSVPAVKSLLVRARVGLAQALEARDAACSQIREELIISHDRGVRPNGMARRHMRDCAGCREFRCEVRGLSRQFAALAPALGPAGIVAKLLGIGGGAGSGAAAAGGGAAAAGGAAGTTGAVASAGVFATGATHVVTLLAAAVLTAGGAVEIQRTVIAPAPAHRSHHHRVAGDRGDPATASYSEPSAVRESGSASASQSKSAVPPPSPLVAKTHHAPASAASTPASSRARAADPAPPPPGDDGIAPADTGILTGSSTDPGASGPVSSTAPGGASASGASTPAAGTSTGAPGGGSGGASSPTGGSAPGSSTPTSSGGSIGVSPPSTTPPVTPAVGLAPGSTSTPATGPTSGSSGTGTGS